MRSKIRSIINELKSEFFERDRVIEAAWCAILSRNHMFLLGVPGTAKSAVIDSVCRRIEGANYFQWLLTRFSTPEEIFGPVSLKGLENDEYRRVLDGKLPVAQFGFLDEIWKGNSAILNSLLTIVNERKFDNGKDRINVPLISVFGASNELPDGEELDALYDRIILRYDIKYIQENKNWCNLIKQEANKSDQNTTITMDELIQAQRSAQDVKIPDETINTMRDIKMSLEHDGIVASDRRWKQTVPVLKAWAWLDNKDVVSEQDLELLCDMLWKEPEQRNTIVSKVLSVTNPLDLEATRYYDDCLEVFSQFTSDGADAMKAEVAAKLKAALGKIESTLKIADPTKTKKMNEVRESIKGWYRDVVASLDL